MISYVRGKLARKAPTRVVVEVGGLGYDLAVSLTTYDRLPALGAEVQLFTHHYVREDRQELFGFADEEEREAFELLIGVSGIGPNTAQTVLSGMSVAALREAIFYERVAELTAVKGIGRKTAERVVVELKDRIQTATGPSGQPGAPGQEAGEPAAAAEAVLALTTLGFAAPAARKAVDKAAQKAGPDQTVQELVKQALKER